MSLMEENNEFVGEVTLGQRVPEMETCGFLLTRSSVVSAPKGYRIYSPLHKPNRSRMGLWFSSEPVNSEAEDYAVENGYVPGIFVFV